MSVDHRSYGKPFHTTHYTLVYVNVTYIQNMSSHSGSDKLHNHRLGGSPNLLYKPTALSMGKWQISTSWGTWEPILMKLGMIDYVQDPTPHDNFGEGSAMWVVWANM